MKRNTKWSLFANVLGQKEFAKLELASIDYRLPTIGAVINDGKLFTNVAFHGLRIEYQENGDDWVTFTKPVKVKGLVNVRSRSNNCQRVS